MANFSNYYSMGGGRTSTRGIREPGSPAAAQAQNQLTNQYRQQTEDAGRLAQQRINQDYDDTQRRVNQQRASNVALGMLGNPSNPRSSNGMEFEVSSPGDGGGGAMSRPTGGLAIGGGVFPDIIQQLSNFRNSLPPIQPPQNVPPPTVPSTSGAFAHAKDVAGRQGTKAIEALANEMTRRGMSDSGMAGVGVANILGGVGRQQADAEYQAANTDNTRQWEANQLAYQGQLSQNQQNYQAAINQRNQDLSAYLQLLQQMY